MDRACGSKSGNRVVVSGYNLSAILSKGSSSFFYWEISSIFYFLVKHFYFNFMVRGTSFPIIKFRKMFWPKKYALISKLNPITAM